MKIERIRLEEFRRFREPLSLDALDDGLNLFVGPNEAGKSTVAAAVRAAFLERFKTTKVSDFAPWDSAGARPTVEIDFSFDGHRYQLRKTFLSRARCELVVDAGADRLEGEAAEDALAKLLGFEFAAKGQSRAEHAGVPGLLWIRQGEGQDLLEPAGHAAGHLREALLRQSGELVSDDGDRLHARVSAERAAMRDARSGRPKGDFKAAEDAVNEAEAELATLREAQSRLDHDVDQLARLREQHALATAEQTWVALDAQAAQARTHLATIERERDTLEATRRELAQAMSTVDLLQDQAARDQREDARQADQARELAEATAAADAARQAVDQAEAQRARADTEAAAARALLDRAQARDERRQLDAQLTRVDRERTRLQEALAQVAAMEARIDALRPRLDEKLADPKALDPLRKAESTLTALRLRVEAAATRVQIQLVDGVDARLNAQALPAGTAHTLHLTEPATLHIDGVGEIQLTPGGADLPALRNQIDEAVRQRDGLLVRLGASDLADAEARHAAAVSAARDLDLARAELRIHAPQGAATLREALAEARTELARLQARHGALDASDDDLPDLETAAAAHRDAQAVATQAADRLARLRPQADRATAAAQLLTTQAQALERERADPTLARDRAERAGRLVDAQARREKLAGSVEQLSTAIAAHQPDLIEQDARRFEASARIARAEHDKRHAEILQLQGRLEEAGSQGIGERIAALDAERERLRRRLEELQARAAALDLLHARLGARRDAATQRLQAPLARRLQHYLRLVFPDAALRLGDDLLPARLHRGNAEGELLSLSFGTQEQLGVLARLAYADLLQEAGKPTTLILDDALVHADPQRHAAMKRALFDAATRHQVLIFSCHASHWNDLGVAPRPLA